MNDLDAEQIKEAVRDHYGKVAEADAPGCAPGCCGGGAGSSLRLGYSEQDLAGVPAGADLGLGCGNPQAIADLRPVGARFRRCCKRAATSRSTRVGACCRAILGRVAQSRRTAVMVSRAASAEACAHDAKVTSRSLTLVRDPKGPAFPMTEDCAMPAIRVTAGPTRISKYRPDGVRSAPAST
jgi:hypothetical protein